MSLSKIILGTNKSVSNVGDFIRKIGQEERGQTLPVVITDANGANYDLSDIINRPLQIKYCKIT